MTDENPVLAVDITLNGRDVTLCAYRASGHRRPFIRFQAICLEAEDLPTDYTRILRCAAGHGPHYSEQLRTGVARLDFLLSVPGDPEMILGLNVCPLTWRRVVFWLRRHAPKGVLTMSEAATKMLSELEAS